MLNKKKLLLSAILSWSLISCTPSPPDVPACESLEQRLSVDPSNGHQTLTPDPICMEKIHEPKCGHCVYIVSGKELFVGELPEHFLDKKPWSKILETSVMLPAIESYAPLSKYIINSCAKMHCNEQVDRFKIKLDSLNGIKGAIENP